MMTGKNISNILLIKDFDSRKITKRNDEQVLTVALLVFHLLSFDKRLWWLLSGYGISLPSDLHTYEAQ